MMENDFEEQLIEDLFEELKDFYSPEASEAIGDAIFCGEHEIGLRQLKATIKKKNIIVSSKYDAILN